MEKRTKPKKPHKITITLMDSLKTLAEPQHSALPQSLTAAVTPGHFRPEPETALKCCQVIAEPQNYSHHPLPLLQLSLTHHSTSAKQTNWKESAMLDEIDRRFKVQFLQEEKHHEDSLQYPVMLS